MSKELNEALERVLNGVSSDGDYILLKKAFTTGDITISSGDRAVSIKNNTNSPVITGDNCLILNIDGRGGQEEIIEALRYLFDRINLSTEFISSIKKVGLLFHNSILIPTHIIIY